MSKNLRTLKAVTRTQGNNAALKDGRVKPEGFNFEFEEVPVLPQAFRRMVRGLEFDVSEMALTTYLTAREHGVAFTALPIFLVRGFHHGAILQNINAGIKTPKDLEGKRVGVNRGYTVTTGVWRVPFCKSSTVWIWKKLPGCFPVTNTCKTGRHRTM